MPGTNSDYYERRRQQCLQSADSAADAAVAKVHRNFAAHYRTAAKLAARQEVSGRAPNE
ncbi:hypothetical protein ACFB49_46330 [Sphingomonas sp. DBB INV C78]|uniref:hypothetical protein n=1 Tax=Sphingomonas sp. DBB INV C78 TaxID=3349434 RepID=UPI0036D32DCE